MVVLLCITVMLEVLLCVCLVFFFKQKTAYEMRMSDWSSDVCSSDLTPLQTVDGRDRSTVLRIAVIVVDGQERQGGLEQELVEAQVEITGDDRPGPLGQAIGVPLQQRARLEQPAIQPDVQFVHAIDRSEGTRLNSSH